MALWSLLGARPVTMVAWESFGEGLVSDVTKELKLKDVTTLKAPYGDLPDLLAARWPDAVDTPTTPAWRSIAISGRRDSCGGIEGRYGVFVVEGARTVRVLLGTSFPVLSVLLLSTRLDALADVVRAAQERDAPVYVADRATLDRIAGFPIHRGVLALAQRRPRKSRWRCWLRSRPP